MADSAPVLIWVSDSTKDGVWFNKPWLDFVGRSLEQECGHGWTEGIHPDDYERTFGIYSTSFDARRAFTMEYRLRRHDGEYCWFTDKGVPRYTTEGEFVGFIGTCLDITELKLTEMELADARKRLELAVASAELGTFYCPMPLGVIYWNAKCKEHFFLPPDAEVDFDVFYSIIHPDDRKPTRDAIEKAVFERQSYDVQYRTVAADGRKRWVRAKGRAYYDEEGVATRFDGITIDISDLKQAEEERTRLLESEQAARAEAEKNSLLKDEFLATLSHELRTPLQSILGWTDVLNSGESDAEEMAEGLTVIGRNARAQARIIEDLLDMSRILSGKLRLDVQRVALAAVIEAAVESLKPAAQAKKIRLQAILDPWAQPVSGDPNRLQQIFWNLLSNAIKFTPSGGKVQILLERVNSHLEISVTDTGVGISPDFLPYVFERFRQADATSTRRQGGLGLGLAIVKNLTELHGGTIRAKSGGESTGATFTVTLPLAPLHSETEGQERRHPRAASEQVPLFHEESVRLDDLQVLVVDDEEDARNIVALALKKAGAKITLASSAGEALNLIRSTKPDVLVSDIGMPGEDGYSLIRTLRQLPDSAGGDIPAIALSAYARAEDRIRAISGGFQVHLTKPADSRELVALVKSFSRRRQQG